MTITLWPVVDRTRVVHAFKPGEPAAVEGPFRTLRAHEWATAGVRVTRRSGKRLGGQMTIFSSLNVEAARLARRGVRDAAGRLARAAEELESGPEFMRLQTMLADMPAHDAESVVAGTLPDNAPTALADVVKELARRTEELRGGESALATLVETIAGRITEVHEGYVLLVLVSGPTTIVPRWMAVAARRDKVGQLLALVMDKLDAASAVVEALPAIDINNLQAHDTFSPFGRRDPRVRHITAADERLLRGQPEPLRVLVPVRIEA
ncbi:hypothetical protein ONA91_25035 [Micromonospora sp. DR5-3]|uniref:hypothetical protein n=1 Tax=unclassified Micromonospora TaxID=2617518 RepID=UPI0011D849EF|nr:MULTISPECIES: hypothetical protein [unclassified Micromonospora]MCW3817722.1 hypothetical protein [Micromonospora sp. DR5-3]TYC20031.1 hypothetical protein FXF52_33490 [Micromonospora sp. MP36]